MPLVFRSLLKSHGIWSDRLGTTGSSNTQPLSVSFWIETSGSEIECNCEYARKRSGKARLRSLLTRFFRKFTRIQKFHKNHFIFILWSFGTEPKDWLFRAAVWNRFGFVVFGCIQSSSTPNKRGKFMKIWVLILRWKRIKNFLKAHRRNWLKWILEVVTQPFKVKFYDDCAGG